MSVLVPETSPVQNPDFSGSSYPQGEHTEHARINGSTRENLDNPLPFASLIRINYDGKDMGNRCIRSDF